MLLARALISPLQSVHIEIRTLIFHNHPLTLVKDPPWRRSTEVRWYYRQSICRVYKKYYVGVRCQGEGPRAMEGAKPHFHVVQSHTKVGTLPSDAWSKNRRYLIDPRSY